ncbi:MAG: arginine--tRNA ligase [Zavarzinella sp.]
MQLIAEIQGVFRPILEQLFPEQNISELLQLIRPAQQAAHGDYQANCAMPLGKKVGRNPREIANEIVAALPTTGIIQSAEVAGAGFINLTISPQWLSTTLTALANDDRLGISQPEKPRKVVIDYSSPNVAKPLHVGHLRSSIIGDAITRLLRFLGHHVVTDNHLGDWGTQFGMLIYGYRNFLDPAGYKENPVAELARLYKLVRKKIKEEGGQEDEGGPTSTPIADTCRLETAKLHGGDAANMQLWQEFMPHCLAEIHATYKMLGMLPFDHEFGESYYNEMLPGIVQEMLAKNLAQESQGAVVIPNAKGIYPTTPEELTTEEPPALIRKRDGAFTYTTTDLATIRYRQEKFTPDELLYVVDYRQALHFKTLFAHARRWGWDQTRLEHISFGAILGEDGKPLQTREGDPYPLNDLCGDASGKGLEKYHLNHKKRIEEGKEVPSLSKKEIFDIGVAVGIGAMKYADLSQNRTSNYKYSPAKMLATDGNTGSYMQYAYARCCGIFRKAGCHLEELTGARIVISEPQEKALALQLCKFEDVLQDCAKDFYLHSIASYLWDLAKAANVFYDQCEVLTAPTAEIRSSRLMLVELIGKTIKQALDILGIQTVEQM